MTIPADTKVLEENSNIQPNEENTENIVEESSGGVQPMASQVSLLYRAPAVLIDNVSDISKGGENILFKYEGQTLFDGWYCTRSTGEVTKWWCSDKGNFKLYKDEDTSTYSNNINFQTGGIWSSSGPDDNDSASLGDKFQLTTNDGSWGIMWDKGTEIKECFEVYEPFSVSAENYKLCGFLLFNDTNLPGWTEDKANDYDENLNFILYIDSQNTEGLASKSMSVDFREYADFDRVYIAPVYKRFSEGNNGTVNFLQGQGIIINSFPDFTSKQYPELITEGKLFKGLVAKTDTDLFAGKDIVFNTTTDEESESKTLPVDLNGDATGEQFEVYQNTNFKAQVAEFDHERTENYNFLGYVLTAMDDLEKELSSNPLCWFAPYKEDKIVFTGVNYSGITDMGSWDPPYPYNYIRVVWLPTTAPNAYSHCPIDTNREEYSDITWTASYSISSTSKTFHYSHNNTGIPEGTFSYNGANRPSIIIDVNSLADDDEFTLTLSEVECEQEIIGWELWNINNESFMTFMEEQNPSFVINGKTLREISHNEDTLLYVVPVINPVQSTTFSYTNNTAWDVVVRVGENKTTLDRWSKGQASITAESLDGAEVLFDEISILYNDFALNNELTLNYGDSKLYNELIGLIAEYNILAFLPIYKTNVFTFDFSTSLGWERKNISSSVNEDQYISFTEGKIKVKLEEGGDLEKQAKLVLGGFLDFNFDSCTAHNKNEELNSINYNYPPHEIGSPNSNDSILTPVEHKVGTSENIQYWEHTDSVWSSVTPYEKGNNYQYNGQGTYAFIINMDDYSPDEKVIFDYEEYNCGTLLGYITSRDNDSQNTVLKNESEFLFGVVAPAVDNIVTIYGFDTNNSELYLLGDLVGNNPTETYAAIINWGNGSGVGYEAYSKIYEFNYNDNEHKYEDKTLSTTSLPIDNSTYQTGNQFVVFRLRNPYDGKVLNHDEDAAYGVTTKYGNTSETHEQPYFLTIWEQRSIFNALNNKITFVNEVSSYEEVQIIEGRELSLQGDYDSHGEINSTTVEQYGDDLTVYSLLRNSRKSGRALVDNIDDWFNWFKREEEPGIIANSQDNTLAGGSPLMFVAPMLNDDYGCCIQSDAVQTSRTLGPGESISVPIVVLYKAYPEQNRDAVKYTIGFDIRNSLYLDPLYYQFTLNAKYSGSVTDSISSQKASIQSSTKYNVTVR